MGLQSLLNMIYFWLMERFKKIEGFENYSISSLGRVRRDVTVTNARAGYFLALVPTRDGYMAVALSRPKHKGKTAIVHRLVAAAFIGPIPEKYVVNHKNGVRHDNRVENLEIITCSENVRHAYEVLGRKPTRAKLAETEAEEIRIRADAGELLKDLADEYDITPAMVSNIVRGRAWKSVPGTIRTFTDRKAKVELTEAQVVEMRHLRAGGVKLKELAVQFNITICGAANIVRGKTWKQAGGPIAQLVGAKPVRLTDDEALVVVRRYKAGESATNIADDIGMHVSAVHKLGKGRTRPHLQDLV